MRLAEILCENNDNFEASTWIFNDTETFVSLNSSYIYVLSLAFHSYLEVAAKHLKQIDFLQKRQMKNVLFSLKMRLHAPAYKE